MSKAIRSYPENLRYKKAVERVAAKTMGLGYWAAVAYLAKTGGLTNQKSVV